jgi:RNA polymerase sigma-70 factor (ECF subfamily)
MADPHDHDPADDSTPTAHFGRLLEAALPRLKQFVRFHSGPVIRARECDTDIAQSVCREAVADRKKFVHGGSHGMKTWLFTRAWRKIQDRVRFHTADKRDIGRETPIQRGTGSGSGPGPIPLADSATPDRIAIEGELERRLKEAIEQLPDDYRKVVVLSRFEGLSHSEIAGQIGRTEVATRKLLHRALVTLARSV